MVEFHDEKKNANTSSADNNAATGNVSGFSVGTANEMNMAFEWSSVNSQAGKFVEVIKEAAKENQYLANFQVGTVDAVTGEFGSAAYVAGELRGIPLFGIVFFEKGLSLRLVVNNNQEDYYSIASLINKDVIATVAKTLKTTHSLSQDPRFISINTIPDLDLALTRERALSIMGQMMTSIFGRASGILGKLVITKNDKFIAQVGGIGEGAVLDVNGHAQRADFGIKLSHVPLQQNTTPTLMSGTNAQQYPNCAAAGYANLRYTGLVKNADGSIKDMRQISPELVISLMDSSTLTANAPFERQILMLAVAAKTAAMGGWMDFIKNSLDGKTRKISALAQNVNWGKDVSNTDWKAMDKSVEAAERFLREFCYETAGLVVEHRAGNGIGGLIGLIAEVAQNKQHALETLLALLDNMFPVVEGNKFSDGLRIAFGGPTVTLSASHIVSGVVPTVAGVYRGSNGMRSYSDMDLLRTTTALGDDRAEVLKYFRAQSYKHRNMQPKQQRIYLAQLANSLFSGNDPIPTGEGVQISINTTFAKFLYEAVDACGLLQLTGVNAMSVADSVPFYNNTGDLFVMSGVGGVSTNNAFDFAQQSGYFNM
ncbi:hypothetical protein HOV30_gp024 [Erwinia phage Derbicus]|uniref:Uncharacterized protein n=2 Tax=Derbicusvirus derbicus TaxID=2734104 RepID=A0A482IKY4_9CAUD|nr:hypothetical protein BIZ82_gp024 [Erwinia phage vB_EamM_EarlPhillipIV]YP_009821068.1 hypothetical protein HOV30_gp024 [Erwinia phage Derbicus]ANZ48874.1 hypothetical protein EARLPHILLIPIV_24 [Erwinia phage vB_EamM_EarlPhillipIV]QBP07450.1 hypothetical protein DERBICUS_24 [Erwinia phage Derbicus]